MRSLAAALSLQCQNTLKADYTHRIDVTGDTGLFVEAVDDSGSRVGRDGAKLAAKDPWGNFLRLVSPSGEFQATKLAVSPVDMRNESSDLAAGDIQEGAQGSLSAGVLLWRRLTKTTMSDADKDWLRRLAGQPLVLSLLELPTVYAVVKQFLNKHDAAQAAEQEASALVEESAEAKLLAAGLIDGPPAEPTPPPPGPAPHPDLFEPEPEPVDPVEAVRQQLADRGIDVSDVSDDAPEAQETSAA